MPEIVEDSTTAGRWFQLYQDGAAILSAHQMNQEDEAVRLTVMWSGRPSQPPLAVFCTKMSEQLDLLGAGKMSFLGREFRDGRESRFTGADWLDAGAKAGAKLLRYECSATPEARYAAAPLPIETVIVWAALDISEPDREWNEERDDDENVGVNLQLPRLQTLEEEIATLIAQTHRDKIDVGLVRDVLRFLAEYLAPRPQAQLLAI